MDISKLNELRKNLDTIDEQIVALLAERQMNVDAIGSVKLDTKSPTRDYEREKQVIDNVIKVAKEKNVDSDIVKQIFTLIIKTSLEKQENQKIDLLVTDVVMPNMDGPTLAQRMRQTSPGLKIIFMSGYTEDKLKDHMGENIFFLPKPFTLKQLAAKVKDVLGD